MRADTRQTGKIGMAWLQDVPFLMRATRRKQVDQIIRLKFGLYLLPRRLLLAADDHLLAGSNEPFLKIEIRN